MSHKRLDLAEKQRRKEARQQALRDREARRVAAGLPKAGSVGEVFQRLRGEYLAPAPASTEITRLPAMRATAKSNTAEARARIYELAAQQEREQRAAHERIDAMGPEERAELLQQLRAGHRPSWLPAITTINE